MGSLRKQNPRSTPRRSVDRVEPQPYIPPDHVVIIGSVREGANIVLRTVLVVTLVVVMIVLCCGFLLFPEFRDKFVELLLRLTGAVGHLVRFVFAR
jgi:hypothetical protein